jgi:formiminoglutamase
MAKTSPLPIIQSIPHAGFGVPAEIKDLLVLSERDIYNDCDLWADLHYDFSQPELGSPAGSEINGRAPLAVVTTDIARALIDVNRKPDDLKNPDGMIKSRSSYGAPNYKRPLRRDEMLALRTRYYHPYHERMETALSAHAGRVRLLLDCHNMAQRSPDAYAHAGKPRPLICLANLGDSKGEPKSGGPAVTCAPNLLRAAGEIAESLFADMTLLEPAGPVAVVGLNRPFPGGYIIRRYTQGQRQASPVATAPASIMIEVNRGLFVGNQSATTPVAPPNAERVAAIRERLYRWVVEVVALFA